MKHKIVFCFVQLATAVEDPTERRDAMQDAATAHRQNHDYKIILITKSLPLEETPF